MPESQAWRFYALIGLTHRRPTDNEATLLAKIRPLFRSVSCAHARKSSQLRRPEARVSGRIHAALDAGEPDASMSR